MQIHAKFIDDFKTERKDVAPPLPGYLRLVPMFFYLSIVAAILLNALFVARFSQASRMKEAAVNEDKRLLADLDAAKTQRQQLETEAKKASDLAAWVDASRPLQPLVVEIARSMAPASSLVELRLDRDADNASQIRMTLRLQSNDTRQLDETLQTIANSRYRTYSPQQSMDKGEVDYKATLLWQDASREPATPVQ